MTLNEEVTNSIAEEKAKIEAPEFIIGDTSYFIKTMLQTIERLQLQIDSITIELNNIKEQLAK